MIWRPTTSTTSREHKFHLSVSFWGGANPIFYSIVDSAIYIPNPHNASDNYSIYTDGNDRDVFLKNPDGSEYIGSGMVYPLLNFTCIANTSTPH